MRPSLEELPRERYPSLDELLHGTRHSLEGQTHEGRPSLEDLVVIDPGQGIESFPWMSLNATTINY